LPDPLLEVEGLSKRFGGLLANQDVTFAIYPGEVVGLIGPNGAGKTTLFNCITGFYRPDGGRVRFEGVDITGWPPDKICRAGIARTFQVVRIFRGLTAFENVMVGALLRHPNPSRAAEVARKILDLTGLSTHADELVDGLPIALKKRVEMARSLATGPKLLLLDEVMAGLNPRERQAAVELVRRVRSELGVTVLMVEHVMEVVMPLSDRVIVLDFGVKIAEGRPQEVINNPEVIKAYLGERYAARFGRLGGV
jgi:branched-chain amino acid transport system ATP-binding protein